eukprot:scaffold58025_cov80-Phaeocystis_antarctica.AAC.3
MTTSSRQPRHPQQERCARKTFVATDDRCPPHAPKRRSVTAPSGAWVACCCTLVLRVRLYTEILTPNKTETCAPGFRSVVRKHVNAQAGGVNITFDGEAAEGDGVRRE